MRCPSHMTFHMNCCTTAWLTTPLGLADTPCPVCLSVGWELPLHWGSGWLRSSYPQRLTVSTTPCLNLPPLLRQGPKLVSISHESCQLLAGLSAALTSPYLRKTTCAPSSATPLQVWPALEQLSSATDHVHVHPILHTAAPASMAEHDCSGTIWALQTVYSPPLMLTDLV